MEEKHQANERDDDEQAEPPQRPAALPDPEPITLPKNKRFRVVIGASGNVIQDGAMLEVSGESLPQTYRFPLKLSNNGKRWKVLGSDPDGLPIDKALPPGSTVTIVIRNPDGTVIAPRLNNG